MNRDLTENMHRLREWNAQRKKTKMQLALKSCAKFTLAGKRYKAGVLSAAKHAKELEKKGIDWHNVSPEELKVVWTSSLWRIVWGLS